MKPKNQPTVDRVAHPIGMFAVARHASSVKRAHFVVLHPTYEAAAAEAVRLVVLMATAEPQRQHHFYVVEVAARFSAGIDGLQSQERTA